MVDSQMNKEVKVFAKHKQKLSNVLIMFGVNIDSRIEKQTVGKKKGRGKDRIS